MMELASEITDLVLFVMAPVVEEKKVDLLRVPVRVLLTL